MRLSPRQMRAPYQRVLWLVDQYEMTEVIPPLVNVSRSGSLHATGAIIIIVMVTYRSPPTSKGITVMLFFLLVERWAAIPSMSENLENCYCRPQSGSEAAPVTGWS